MAERGRILLFDQISVKVEKQKLVIEMVEED